MIPKGNQRGGGRQLATHLMNAVDNERVEIMEMRGSVARDLHGAFAEWEALASATNCRKYLYSLSINPDHRQKTFTPEHYIDFLRRAEKSLGLSGQPVAVVRHVKNGREHWHAVWSRIEPDRLRAINIAHDRQKLRAVAREYARDHQLVLPPRMREDKGRDRFRDRAHESHAEKQQQERSGITKQQRQSDIHAAWLEFVKGADFIAALAQRGYTLARGDRRSHVVIDRAGEIHSLPRQLKGVPRKDRDAALSSLPFDALPAAKDARKQQIRISAKEHFRISSDGRRDALAHAHRRRREALDTAKADLARRHKQQIEAMAALHRDLDRQREARSRPKGLAGFLARVTGRLPTDDPQRHRREKLRAEAFQRLSAIHARERRDLSRRYSALARVEKRELRSLETSIRREIIAPDRTPEKARSIPAGLRERIEARAEQALRERQIGENARDITAPPPEPAPRKKTGGLSEKFRKAIEERADRKEAGKTRNKSGQDREGPAPD